MLAEDLAVDTSKLCSRNGNYSSVQMLSEPHNFQVDLLEGCGFSPHQEPNSNLLKAYHSSFTVCMTLTNDCTHMNW